jgi:hypothetical protein
MKRLITSCAAAFFAVCTIAASPNAQEQPLLAALNPNPALRSYVAVASLRLDIHLIATIHRSFSGTAYYLKPRRKIIFDSVSGPLAKFRELETTLPSPEEVTTQYVLQSTIDEGGMTTFVLAPAQPGRRVLRVTVVIENKTGLIQTAIWDYEGGGQVTTVVRYISQQSFHLAQTEDISAKFPAYHVDGHLSFSNFQIDVPVAPSVFASPSPSPAT